MRKLFVSIDVAEDSLTHSGRQCGLITFGKPLFQEEDGVWYPKVGQEVVAHLSGKHVDKLLAMCKLERGGLYEMVLTEQKVYNATI